MQKVQFLKLAQQELDDAFNYYEYQQVNLGYRFIQEVHDAIELIKLYPSGWSQISKTHEDACLKPFPMV